jgi:hypothetical protein
VKSIWFGRARVSLIVEIAEGQDTSVVNDDIEPISGDTSTDKSDFSGERREFIEPIGRFQRRLV